MRKTKIICTIGPASEHEDVLTRMIKAGMDVARLNFSHGSHEEHQGKIDLIKKVRQKLHMPIAIVQIIFVLRINIPPDADHPISFSFKI